VPPRVLNGRMERRKGLHEYLPFHVAGPPPPPPPGGAKKKGDNN
jgi:hypothetical protein